MFMREWFKTAAVAAVFLLATFLVLELSLRVYLFGSAGFSPAKVGSFSMIFDSGLVQPAENLEIWYELKPNQNKLFRGAPFRTNSQGLADDEYELEKPPNTIRVAVVGSSWAMGSGVALEDTYHSVLEHQFNRSSRPTRYEFINFGVENYGLQEIVATVRDKALRYNPDLILFEMTESTPHFRWAPRKVPFVPLPARNRAWNSIVWLEIAGFLGIRTRDAVELQGYVDNVRPTEYGLVSRQVARALEEIGELGRNSNIPVAAAWIRLAPEDGNKLGPVFLDRAAKAGVAGFVVEMDKLLQPGEDKQKVLVSRAEPHPNAYGHGLIAAELQRQIFADNPLFATP
jgi:hypothetical protein